MLTKEQIAINTLEQIRSSARVEFESKAQAEEMLKQVDFWRMLVIQNVQTAHAALATIYLMDLEAANELN